MSRIAIYFLSLATAFAVPLTTLVADDSQDHGNMSAGSKSLHEIMEKSSQKMPSMKISGDVDKDFAKMMANHHRSGIRMAQIEAEHGKDSELKNLAQKIINSQKEELSTLEKHAE